MPNLSRAAVFAGLLLACGGALAQQPPIGVKRDPKVQAVIDQTLAAYRALTGLHLKVSVKTTGPADMMRGAPDSIELKYQKPNKLYSAVTTRGAGDAVERKLVVSDGANLWAWLSDTNTYNKVKAPPLLKTAPFIGHDLPEYDLLFRDKDPFADLPGTANLALGPPAKVGDVDVDVLKASATEQGVPFTLNVELLIGQKDHLIHGMYFAGSGKDQGKDVKFDLRMTYDLAVANPTFAPADFTFTPPPGSKPALSLQPPKTAAPTQNPGPKK
jgi:outer membrane lipoprotein-sorting protein